MASSVKWDDNSVQLKLAGVTPKALSYIDMVVNYQSLRGQTDMRRYAPWTDRTANARAGLHVTIDKTHAADSGVWEMRFSHSMFYGVFLELKNGGRFQILMPTIRRTTPRLQQMVANVMAAVV